MDNDQLKKTAETSRRRNERFVDMMCDFGFKYIFTDEALLKSFLNALFQGEWHVERIVYDNSENIPEFKDHKGIRFDMFCRAVNPDDPKANPTQHFIIEMQKRYQSNFDNRTIYYASRALSRQGEKGEVYSFVPVIGISLMNFGWRDESEDTRLIERKGLADLDTHEPFSDLLRLYYIKLPMLPGSAAECRTLIDQWLFCVKNLNKMDNIPFKTYHDIFEELEARAEVANLSNDQYIAYERSLKAQRDYENTLNTEYRTGHAEGLAEGLAEGAWEKLCSVVRNLRLTGLDNLAIAKMIGESPETVASI